MGTASLMQTDNPTSDLYQIEFEAEPQYVATARLFAAAVARHHSCAEECVQDVKVAISEACSNAMKAHAEADVEAPIQIVARRDGETLIYEVIDRGRGFEFRPNPQPAVPNPTEFFEGGVGLMLIQSLFPAVEIQSADGGTTVRFSVELSSNGEG